MRKLLRSKDILFLILAGIGDLAEEVKDPLHLLSSSYESMYGFVPRRYKKSNFLQTVRRNLKTHDIEKVLKDGKVYLRLTSIGKTKIYRDFPILKLTRKWNKHWAIVVFDIEEKAKLVRNRFRKKLRSLGFGMLQKSIWISPLSMGEDMKEVIETIGLSKKAFVMEVSGFIFGDPRELASKIWHLDKLDDESTRVKKNIENVNQLIRNRNDRIKKSKAKFSGKRNNYIYELEKKKKEVMKKYLEFIVQLPPLPMELLPVRLRDITEIKF